MAFVTKTWKDRLVEYAGRRKLKNVATGEEILMDVSRSEGTVNQAGDAFSAANMNNLEQRIKTEFDSVNSSLGGLTFGTDGDGNYGYYGADGSLIPFKRGFEIVISTGRVGSETTASIQLIRLENNSYNNISIVCTTAIQYKYFYYALNVDNTQINTYYPTYDNQKFTFDVSNYRGQKVIIKLLTYNGLYGANFTFKIQAL